MSLRLHAFAVLALATAVGCKATDIGGAVFACVSTTDCPGGQTCLAGVCSAVDGSVTGADALDALLSDTAPDSAISDGDRDADAQLGPDAEGSDASPETDAASPDVADSAETIGDADPESDVTADDAELLDSTSETDAADGKGADANVEPEAASDADMETAVDVVESDADIIFDAIDSDGTEDAATADAAVTDGQSADGATDSLDSADASGNDISASIVNSVILSPVWLGGMSSGPSTSVMWASGGGPQGPVNSNDFSVIFGILKWMLGVP